MAGFRPTQVVIGIAGELVKGFTHDPQPGAQEARPADHRGRAQRLIVVVQREALQEAERAITWETGLPARRRRLVPMPR
jgi:hypothetical protein